FFQTEFMLSWTAELPPDTRLSAGRWWTPPYHEPMVSVGQAASRWLRIPVGSELEFVSSDRVIRARVTSVREVDFSRPGNNTQFLFSPGVLDGLPASYYGGVRVWPEQVPGVQGALFARFPNVTTIDVGQVLRRVQELIDKIARVVQFIALF